MPLINAVPRGMSNGEVVTSLIDTVGTTSTTFTFPSPQDKVKFTNKGTSNIQTTVSGVSQTITPSGSYEFNGSISSFDILSTSGVQPFELDATNNQSDEIQLSPDGRKFKIVACVIRNSGSGWSAIDDSGHKPLNVSSVNNDTSVINVNFPFTAKKVVSFVAVPDEQLAMAGIQCGSSVTQSLAAITLARHTEIGGSISWASGTTFNIGSTSTYGWGTTPINSVVWDGISFRLTVTHASFADTTYGKIRSLPDVIPWGGANVPAIFTYTDNTVSVEFYDYAGVKLQIPDAGFKFHFKRSGNGILNPNEYTNAQGNIWCYGIFEV